MSLVDKAFAIPDVLESIMGRAHDSINFDKMRLLCKSINICVIEVQRRVYERYAPITDPVENYKTKVLNRSVKPRPSRKFVDLLADTGGMVLDGVYVEPVVRPLISRNNYIADTINKMKIIVVTWEIILRGHSSQCRISFANGALQLSGDVYIDTAIPNILRAFAKHATKADFEAIHLAQVCFPKLQMITKYPCGQLQKEMVGSAWDTDLIQAEVRSVDPVHGVGKADSDTWVTKYVTESIPTKIDYSPPTIPPHVLLSCRGFGAIHMSPKVVKCRTSMLGVSKLHRFTNLVSVVISYYQDVPQSTWDSMFRALEQCGVLKLKLVNGSRESAVVLKEFITPPGWKHHPYTYVYIRSQ